MAKSRKRPGAKDFKNNLLAANQAIVKLRTGYQEVARQYSELVVMFCAVLMEKHDGKVHIPIASAMKWQNYMISRDVTKDLGILTLRVEKPGTTATKPQLIAPDAKEADQTADDSICDNVWHGDPEALGLRCPNCGGKGKRAAA